MKRLRPWFTGGLAVVLVIAAAKNWD